MLSERIQECLKRMGCNQAELADMLGVSRQTVALWMKGITRHLQQKSAWKLARLAGVSLKWLESGAAPMLPAKTARLDIGYRIRKRRESLGVSQTEVAESIGLTQPEVSKLELGRRSIEGDLLIDVAIALKTEPDWIMTGSVNGDPPPKRDEQQAQKEERDQELLRTLLRLTPDHPDAILAAAKALEAAQARGRHGGENGRRA